MNLYAPAIYIYGTIYNTKAGFENLGINLEQRYIVFGDPDGSRKFIISEDQHKLTYPVDCANLECLQRDMRRKGVFKWDIRLSHRLAVAQVKCASYPESIGTLKASDGYILVKYWSGRYQFTRANAINWNANLNAVTQWWNLSAIDPQAIAQYTLTGSII